MKRIRILCSFVAVSLLVGCGRTVTSQPVELRAEPGIVGQVARWLDEYEAAWNARDLRRVAQMRALDAGQVWLLERSIEDRLQLRVDISDLRIQKADENVASAHYVRRDHWIDRASGHSRSTSGAFEHTFRLDGNELREVSLKHR
jgi:hypothetical protein